MDPTTFTDPQAQATIEAARIGAAAAIHAAWIQATAAALALPEGVVKRIVDRLSCQAKSGRLVAIKSQSQRRARCLLVGRHVAQLGQGLQLGEHLGRPNIQRVGVGSLQSILKLGARGASADGQVLCDLHEQFRALDLVELRAQSGDDLICGRHALFRDDLKDEAGTRTGNIVYAVEPRSYLVVGNLAQIIGNDDKITCFELFRRNIRAPEIITFDELYSRAGCIVENISREIDQETAD